MTRIQGSSAAMNAKPKSSPTPKPRRTDSPWTATTKPATATGTRNAQPMGSNPAAAGTPARRGSSRRRRPLTDASRSSFTNGDNLSRRGERRGPDEAPRPELRRRSPGENRGPSDRRSWGRLREFPAVVYWAPGLPGCQTRTGSDHTGRPTAPSFVDPAEVTAATSRAVVRPDLLGDAPKSVESGGVASRRH